MPSWRGRPAPTPFMMEDGDIITLSPGPPAITDSAPVGRLVLDGTRLVPLKGEVMSARRRMLFNGIVVASLAVDQAGNLRGQPKLSAPGLLDPDDPDTGRITEDFAETLRDLPASLRRDDAGAGGRRPCRAAPRAGDGRWASGRWWMCI